MVTGLKHSETKDSGSFRIVGSPCMVYIHVNGDSDQSKACTKSLESTGRLCSTPSTSLPLASSLPLFLALPLKSFPGSQVILNQQQVKSIILQRQLLLLKVITKSKSLEADQARLGYNMAAWSKQQKTSTNQMNTLVEHKLTHYLFEHTMGRKN